MMTAVVLASSTAASSVSFSSKMMTSSPESFQATAYPEDNTITAQEVNIISSDDVENKVDRPHAEPSSYFVAVGILDLCDATTPNCKGSKILIRNRLNDGSDTDEWWRDKRKQDSVGVAARNVALSSVIGISCDGIVIRLPDTIVDAISSGGNAEECVEILDDVLLSIAHSYIHRTKVGDYSRDSTRQVAITFQTREDCTDVKIRNTKDYIERYLHRALSILQGRERNDYLRNNNDTLSVKVSLNTAADTAMHMASILLSGKDSSDLWQLQQIKIIRNKLELIEDESIIMPKKTNVSPTHSTGFRDKVETALAAVLSGVEDDLNSLERKIDDSVLEGGGDVANPPMPEFGTVANALLSRVSESSLNAVSESEVLTEADREWAESKRIETIKHVAGVDLHRLYRLHLQNLRDHFGRTYEEVLDKTSAISFGEEMEGDADAQSRDVQRKVGAKRAEEGFLNAAFLSIPAVCQDPQMELVDSYSCTDVLRGLLEDMYEATLSRGIEEEEWNDVMDGSADEASRLTPSTPAKGRVGLRELIKNIKNKRMIRGPAKWYERLAAKALVIGVNYVQGWIVLQTLRREATRRDLTMPKFPLF